MAQDVIAARDLLSAAVHADEQVVTYGQAAWLLRISRRSVTELVAIGAIPTQGCVGRRRIKIGDLRAFKDRQCAAIREISEISEALGYDE